MLLVVPINEDGTVKQDVVNEDGTIFDAWWHKRKMLTDRSHPDAE